MGTSVPCGGADSEGIGQQFFGNCNATTPADASGEVATYFHGVLAALT